MRVISRNAPEQIPADGIWYLYGFHGRGTGAQTDIDGLDNRYPVQAFDHAGLTAYISRVERKAFTGGEAEARLQDIAWVTRKAQLHQRILDALMRDGSLFPVPFGTVFSSLAKLAGAMDSGQRQITDALRRLQGCREWGVQIAMDRPAAIAARTAERVCHLPRSTAAGSPGIKHLQRQRLKRQVMRDMDNWLNQWQTRLLHELKPLSAGFCDRKRLLLEGLICNWAFLVANERREMFFERVRHWQTKGAEYGLQVSITGPWPPYSFCSGIG